MNKILVVGAGFSGSTIARTLAEHGFHITVIDSRPHVAGNAFDFVNEYGIRVHKYGPHLFHTSNMEVVNFLTRFTEWVEYSHKVKALLDDGRLVTLPVNKETPLKYLEIGAFYGANLISVAQTYGAHADSELHCIDPWCDYEEYPEYKGTIESVYDVFKRNIKNAGIEDKVKVYRGFSHVEIPKLQDKYFDLIFVR